MKKILKLTLLAAAPLALFSCGEEDKKADVKTETKNETPSIIGKWNFTDAQGTSAVANGIDMVAEAKNSSQGTSVEFKADGTMVNYNADGSTNNATYKLEANKIMVTTGETTGELGYVLEGDVLKTTLKGESFDVTAIFNRAK